MAKKHQLRRRLILNIILPIFFIYLLTFAYISYQFDISSKNNALQYTEKVSQYFSSQISQKLNKDLYMARSLAQSLQSLHNLDFEDRINTSNNIIHSIVTNNPNYKGTWYNWQLFTFDETRAETYGRVRNTFFSHDGTITHRMDTLDVNGEDPKGLYYTIHKLNSEYVTNPYYEDYEGKLEKPILETSVCIPIKKNGEFAGLAGFDLELDSYDDIIKNLETTKGGNAILFSNNGHIIASKDESLLGKNILELNHGFETTKNLFSRIEETGSFSDEFSNDSISTYVSYSQIKIGNSPNSWGLVYSVPTKIVMHEAYQIRYMLLILLFICTILISFFLIRLVRNIVSPINTASKFAAGIESGNLNTNITNKRKDEIGNMINSLKSMSNRFKEVIKNVDNISDTINHTSQKIDIETSKMAEGAAEQAAGMEEISTSMSEVMDAINKNTENAVKTGQISKEAAEKISISLETVQKANNSMIVISDKVNEVKDIAAQTNILALNASVEAARAGESGKGFAVVAGEVKNLAERVKILTEEIESLAYEGKNNSLEATQKLEEVTPEIIKTAELVNKISSDSENQSVAADQINSGLNQLNQITSQNAAQAEFMRQFTEKLTHESKKMNETIDYFEV